MPIIKFTNKRILITGPTGNLRKVLNGGWTYTWQGNIESTYDFGREKQTLFQAVSKKANYVTYKEGANFTHLTDINQVLTEAKYSDYIILCIGEDAYAETPGNIDSLELSSSQLILARELFKTNRPIIVVYFGGRPRIINEIVDKAKAVLLGFLPGNRGAEAVADILFNDYNPNGKLPFTYPKSSNGFTTYDFKPIEKFDSNNPDKQFLYPFGFGLSYTNFVYSNLFLDKNVVDVSSKDNKILRISIDVKNNGLIAGKEAVILYINDEYGSVSRPVKQVKGFKKVYLDAKETKTVEFEIDALEHLTFIGPNNKRILEDGFFNVYIADLSDRFEVKNSNKRNIRYSLSNANLLINMFETNKKITMLTIFWILLKIF